MKQELIDFINKHEDLIDGNMWEKIYDIAQKELAPQNIGKFTEIIRGADIYPEKQLTNLPDNFLNQSHLERIVIPDNINIVGVAAFMESWISSIQLSDSIVEISDAAFRDCPYLTYIDLPDTLTKLGARVFADSELREISIPTSVVSIGEGCFEGCRKLTDIYFTGTINQWKKIRKEDCCFDFVATFIVRCSDGPTPLM